MRSKSPAPAQAAAAAAAGGPPAAPAVPATVVLPGKGFIGAPPPAVETGGPVPLKARGYT